MRPGAQRERRILAALLALGLVVTARATPGEEPVSGVADRTPSTPTFVAATCPRGRAVSAEDLVGLDSRFDREATLALLRQLCPEVDTGQEPRVLSYRLLCLGPWPACWFAVTLRPTEEEAIAARLRELSAPP